MAETYKTSQFLWKKYQVVKILFLRCFFDYHSIIEGEVFLLRSTTGQPNSLLFHVWKRSCSFLVSIYSTLHTKCVIFHRLSFPIVSDFPLVAIETLIVSFISFKKVSSLA